ncbi:MAG: DUF4249 domain-containing protein [Prolixibacteraceae bacterium]|nr:DUF4249 domain-containing protein [Prolixibacteraceae bacterium]
MRTIKQLFLVITVLLTGCIERYYLDDIIDFTPKLVVDATLVDTDEEQVITLSYSTSNEYPTFEGLANCHVFIIDEDGHIFYANHDHWNVGHYRYKIPEAYLLTGKKFQLVITTPDQKTYRSNFEELLPSPPVDSVYYLVEHHETNKVGKVIDGIQFYINFNASDYFGPYYRWVLEETYEYHSTWPIKDYLSEKGYHTGPIDYSNFICYKTETINTIFLLSTRGLTQNSYQNAKLHFVDDYSQRLMFNYSLLVKQQSLSQHAYQYWENIRKNNQENNGLFNKQPALPKGNMYNVDDSTELVLGYFTVTSENTRRLIIEDVPELLFNNYHFCTANVIDGPLPMVPPTLYFVKYTLFDGTLTTGYTFAECVDCTSLGGTVEKPSFFK